MDKKIFSIVSPTKTTVKFTSSYHNRIFKMNTVYADDDAVLAIKVVPYFQCACRIDCLMFGSIPEARHRNPLATSISFYKSVVYVKLISS